MTAALKPYWRDSRDPMEMLYGILDCSPLTENDRAFVDRALEKTDLDFISERHWAGENIPKMAYCACISPHSDVAAQILEVVLAQQLKKGEPLFTIPLTHVLDETDQYDRAEIKYRLLSIHAEVRKRLENPQTESARYIISQGQRYTPISMHTFEADPDLLRTQWPACRYWMEPWIPKYTPPNQRKPPAKGGKYELGT